MDLEKQLANWDYSLTWCDLFIKSIDDYTRKRNQFASSEIKKLSPYEIPLPLPELNEENRTLLETLNTFNKQWHSKESKWFFIKQQDPKKAAIQFLSENHEFALTFSKYLSPILQSRYKEADTKLNLIIIQLFKQLNILIDQNPQHTNKLQTFQTNFKESYRKYLAYSDFDPFLKSKFQNSKFVNQGNKANENNVTQGNKSKITESNKNKITECNKNIAQNNQTKMTQGHLTETNDNKGSKNNPSKSQTRKSQENNNEPRTIVDVEKITNLQQQAKTFSGLSKRLEEILVQLSETNITSERKEELLNEVANIKILNTSQKSK